jgi:regulator of replication initiation timing
MGDQKQLEDMSTQTQLARLEIQIKTLIDQVTDIKTNVTQIAKLDKTIAEVVIHGENSRENIDQLWKAISDSRTKYESLNSRINTVEANTNEAINKAKGAGWALGIVFGAVQVLVISSMAWVFTNVQEALVINRLQQESIARVEAQVKDITQPRNQK